MSNKIQINPVTGQTVDLKVIKKLQIACYRCGKIACVEISKTMEMTHEMMAYMEGELKNWQKYHCEYKPLK
jgi:hypothetical protein